MSLDPAGPHPEETGPIGPDPADLHRAASVAVVDDHELLANGLADMIRLSGNRARPITISNRLSDPRPIVEEIMVDRTDLVVVDLDLPIPGGGRALVKPVSELGLRVAVLTGLADHLQWGRCIDDGADVVLGKAEPLSDILDAILALLAGQDVRPRQRVELAQLLSRHRAQTIARCSGFDTLSRRERAVLTGLVNGCGTREIADRDSVSVATVRSQVKSMLAKLGVNSQLAAVARANQAGWRPMTDLEAGSAPS